MTEFYFKKFPIITYNNYTCTNITERVALIHSQKVNSEAYSPVEISDTMRADLLAYNAYNDSYLDWMIYLNNNIVDPFYGWHLNESDFQAYIINKYGSWVWAEQAVSYYRLNWPTDDEQISTAYFETNLPGVLKKYYSPVWGPNGTILYYTRALNEWKQSTNQIIQWNISMDTANTVFPANDIIQVISGGQVVGSAQPITANSSVVVAQHVSGNVESPNALQSFLTPSIQAVTSNTIILQTNIDSYEASYWEGVTYYEIEQEENAKKRFLNLVDPSLVMNISSQITTELANN